MTAVEAKKLDKLSDRTSRMEERQENMAEDIKEIKDTLASFIDKYEKDKEGLLSKFITRTEAVAVGVFLSISVTLFTLWLNVKDHLK